MEFLVAACAARPIYDRVHAMKAAHLDDLKKIYLVQQLADTQNLSKTARHQKVTPSAISQSIKSLEVNLGYPVIIRQGENWVLTEKGRSLLDQTKPIFQALVQTFGVEEDRFNLGSLAFGTYESLAIEYIPALSEAIKQDFPAARLSFVTARSRDLIKKIQSGELCSALLVKPDDLPSHFVTQTIFSDSLGIYGTSELIEKYRQSPDEIVTGSMSPGSDGHPLFYKKFLKANEFFKPNFLCDSFEVLRNVAEGSRAITVLPHSVARKANIKLVNIAESAKDVGIHDIVLAASGTCDQREFVYLAQVFSKLAE